MREGPPDEAPTAPAAGRPSGGVSLAPSPLESEPVAGLLQRISEEGGFAFVSSAEKAAAGDLTAAEAAREMAWEQLHSGPWHSVVPAWRDAYALTCLLAAGFHAAAGEFREALRILDMGLIMGGMLLRKDLEEAVRKIVGSSQEKERSGGEASVSELRLGVDDVKGQNQSEVILERLFFENYCYPYSLRSSRINSVVNFFLLLQSTYDRFKTVNISTPLFVRSYFIHVKLQNQTKRMNLQNS